MFPGRASLRVPRNGKARSPAGKEPSSTITCAWDRPGLRRPRHGESEGDVVLRIRRTNRALVAHLSLRTALRRAVAAAEELYVLGHDLDRLPLLPVAGFELAPLEAAIDSDRPALREEPRATLRLRAP